MSGLTSTLGIAVGLYVLLALVMFGCQRSFLYFPDRSEPQLAAAGADGFAAVTLESGDGLRLRHWYRPPREEGGPVVVVFHGNAGHIGHRVEKFRALLDAGFGLFLAEYRGYGGNPGKPEEGAMSDDARTVMAYLLEGIGIPGARLVVYGESLGGGPAVKMAAEHPVAGLVLEAPFTSIADVAQSHYWYLPARWLVLDRWDNARHIAGLKAPLLILHGEADRVVPTRFGRELYALAPEPKEALFLPGAGHNDLLAYPEAAERVIAFVRAETTGPGAGAKEGAAGE